MLSPVLSRLNSGCYFFEEEGGSIEGSKEKERANLVLIRLNDINTYSQRELVREKYI